MISYGNDNKLVKLISHRGSIDGKKPTDLKRNLEKLDSIEVDTVELDFKTTRDNKWVCSHDSIYKMKPIRMQYHNDLKANGLLTLEDIIDILPANLHLLVDIKGTLVSQNDVAIANLISVLNTFSYSRTIQVQCFHDEFVRKLIELQGNKFLNEAVSLGLVVSKMNTNKFKNPKNWDDPFRLGNIDFLSLSSELWEETSVGNEHDRYKAMFPSAERYAWTWAALHPETESRIINYADKGADGIIANSPVMVKSYLEKH